MRLEPECGKRGDEIAQLFASQILEPQLIRQLVVRPVAGEELIKRHGAAAAGTDHRDDLGLKRLSPAWEGTAATVPLM